MLFAVYTRGVYQVQKRSPQGRKCVYSQQHRLFLAGHRQVPETAPPLRLGVLGVLGVCAWPSKRSVLEAWLEVVGHRAPTATCSRAGIGWSGASHQSSDVRRFDTFFLTCDAGLCGRGSGGLVFVFLWFGAKASKFSSDAMKRVLLLLVARASNRCLLRCSTCCRLRTLAGRALATKPTEPRGLQLVVFAVACWWTAGLGRFRNTESTYAVYSKCSCLNYRWFACLPSFGCHLVICCMPLASRSI